ncbi:hypothetical protein EAO77_13625 [Streptomyces sp. t39]|nr:hypothetical protein EAO77_13625 [Streptomyces sp. t39]
MLLRMGGPSRTMRIRKAATRLRVLGESMGESVMRMTRLSCHMLPACRAVRGLGHRTDREYPR